MSPTNGASNASDFQPTTQNPQNIPSNLFQQQGGVQSVTNTQELLNDRQSTTISITRAPAPAPPQAATASETPFSFIILLAAIAAALIFIYRRRARNTLQTAITAETEATIPEEAQSDIPAEPAEAPKQPKKSGKAQAKKKTAKKTKRKRR